MSDAPGYNDDLKVLRGEISALTTVVAALLRNNAVARTAARDARVRLTVNLNDMPYGPTYEMRASELAALADILAEVERPPSHVVKGVGTDAYDAEQRRY